MISYARPTVRRKKENKKEGTKKPREKARLTRQLAVHVEHARAGGDHHDGVTGSIEISVQVVLVEHIHNHVQRLWERTPASGGRKREGAVTLPQDGYGKKTPTHVFLRTKESRRYCITPRIQPYGNNQEWQGSNDAHLQAEREVEGGGQKIRTDRFQSSTCNHAKRATINCSTY